MTRILFAVPALFLSLATGALADGVLYNAPGLSVTVNYQTLAANGGQVQVYCAPPQNFPPPPPPPIQPPPPPPRNCQNYRWTYSVNPQNTSQFICQANGVGVGTLRTCYNDGVCGSEPAIEADCMRLCNAGEFDGQLPRFGWDRGPGGFEPWRR